MASHNGSFDNHVMCPVCLDTYKNPMSLKCRHSMCKQCIDRLVKRNGDVTCPQCRTLSRANDIVKDFQLKSLVDTYKAELPTPKYPCSICQAKAFGFYCQQCKILVCQQCKNNHKNIPACRDHSFSFETYHKDYPLASQFNVNGIEKTGIGSEEALSHFTKYVTDMEKFAIDKIEKAEDRAIQQVKQHHSYLKQKVTSECKSQKKHYKRQRNSLKVAASSLTNKVKGMMNKLQIPDSSLTAAQVTDELDKAESVKKEVQTLKRDYSISRLHSSVAPVVKEGQYSSTDMQAFTKFTSVDFVPFSLCRNGAFIKDATEEWSNMSSHSSYRPGDRLLTPTRNRRRRSSSATPERYSRSPQRRRSRSPIDRQDQRPGPSHGGQVWRSTLFSRERSPWSRSRSRTPIPRSRSFSPGYQVDYYSHSDDETSISAILDDHSNSSYDWFRHYDY